MQILKQSRKDLPYTYIIPDKKKDYQYPPGYKGIPCNRKKRFLNLEHPFTFSTRAFLKWLPGHLRHLIRNRNLRFPVTCQDTAAFLQEPECVMWLGHASFYIRTNGIRILIDPHFYNTFLYRRHTPLVTDPHFFKSIDLILLSHDHPDHCDKASLKLVLKNNPEATLVAGLGMNRLLDRWAKGRHKITCLEWYEQYSFKGLNIFFTPSRHYSRRFLKPMCSTLWGGFVIKSPGEAAPTIYFAGDSGYAAHFKDVGNLFHPDIVIMGIGAYAPRWFMRPNHITPGEAYRAFKDCRGKKMIPMHFQTFNLSNEPMQEPLERIKTIAASQELAVLNPGACVPLQSILKQQQ